MSRILTDKPSDMIVDQVNSNEAPTNKNDHTGRENEQASRGNESVAKASRPTATIPVLEIFGPTVQGEGMVIGQKTMFVRTAGCDYRCSWCDSAFTWDGSAKDQIRKLSAQDVYDELKAIGGDRFNHVTISGGNPALLVSIGELVQLLRQDGIRTAVETQGSRWQDWLLDINDVTISPKPPSSGMETNFEILDSMIRKLRQNQINQMMQDIIYADSDEQAPVDQSISLKVVIFDEADLKYAEQVHKRYPNVPFYMQTGNPDVTSADDNIASSLLHRYEWLIDQAMDMPAFNDARILPQLHTLVWGNKRGV
ncbi:7-carboxy-7-deazaguanine synthase QueE [Paenibacillus shenyangensis]|uniref:7-carboxy-7-deazaguanine synthase QueE n=1 Tax=Paenibacillus sp. A9 TaxID=1284352 RepID=UPI00036EC983|nr:7-carboxy-7-deazaguanine synthase QueE [Paenibacillus sp. A9]